MKKHWYVVANRKAMEIFTRAEQNERTKLTPIKVIRNPLGELKRRDLFKSDAGKSVRSVGRAGSIHYSEVKHNDPLDEVALQFAKEIVDYLRKQQIKNSFATLTIVAEPHFLGKIRVSMHPLLKASVSRWVKKDLMNTPKNKLPTFLLAKKRRTRVELPAV